MNRLMVAAWMVLPKKGAYLLMQFYIYYTFGRVQGGEGT